MKQHPILFSTPMVNAILEGRKTQTRRIVKPMAGKQSEWLTIDKIGQVPHGEIIKGGWQMHHPKAGQFHAGVDVPYNSPLGWIKCPYGQVGDVLWVREKWFPAAITGNRVLIGFNTEDASQSHEFIVDDVAPYWKKLERGCMIPSIHMPKAACRIWLEITDIRVERLQEISDLDALSEGVSSLPSTWIDQQFPEYAKKFKEWKDAGIVTLRPPLGPLPSEKFQKLWQSINGRESWDSNPWVWVISFKQIDKPTNQ